MARFSFDDAQRLHLVCAAVSGWGFALLYLDLLGRLATLPGAGNAALVVPVVVIRAICAVAFWRLGVLPLRRLLNNVGPLQAWEVCIGIFGVAWAYGVWLGVILAAIALVDSPVFLVALGSMALFGLGWMQVRSRDDLRAAAGFSR